MNMKKKRVRGHNEIINKDDVLSFPKSDESDSTLKNNNWEDAPSSSYPCGSADSLSSFLDTHQNSTDRFSKRNPICPSAAQNHIHITVPFYNLDEFTLANAIQSIRQQEYPKHKVTIWVYDDASNSSASNQTLSNVCGQHVFDFPVPDSSRDETWLHTYQFLDTLGFNKAKDASLLCFRATRHLGPGGGKYWLLGLVRAMAKPNDIVLILDGDDTLHHKQGLQIVNQKYIDTTAWFTYGSYEGRWSEQAVDLSSDLRSGKREFRPRADTWVYGYPRSFKAHLLDHLSSSDFKYADESWLIKGTDRGFVYRMLELSGPDRIGYVATKIYNYNYSSTTSTTATVGKELRAAQVLHTQQMKSSKPLSLPLHVVLLTWKRIYLLKKQLIWLQNQTGLKHRRLHLHIVNNNWKQKRAVEEAVDSFRLWQVQYLGSQDSSTQLSSFPINVTVTHNTGKLHHCFARFVYVQQLRDAVPLDDVVFLDDDQYWSEDFLSKLLNEHRSKGMTTWYGKTFQKDETGIANYWKPVYGLIDIVRGKHWPNSSDFKYGGTGGSILDANLWLLDSQLMRLTSDLSPWAKIDDLWTSYVLDALLGWDIRRLKPRTMPIDIGTFRKNDIYHDILSERIPSDTEEELMGLNLPNNQSILESATWTDPSVDKQDMFHTLQTTFLWETDMTARDFSTASTGLALEDVASNFILEGRSLRLIFRNEKKKMSNGNIRNNIK